MARDWVEGDNLPPDDTVGGDGLQDVDAARIEEAIAQSRVTNDRLWDLTGRFSALAGKLGQPASNAAITINGTGAAALVVGLIGVMAIVIAVSAVLVVSAWRSADMTEVESLRLQVDRMKETQDTHAIYLQTHDRRLNQLEK